MQQAALAQFGRASLGKAEVGGSIPLGSYIFKKQSCISGWKVQCLLFFTCPCVESVIN